MITLKADHLSEQHLAEIALAVRNRWNVPTFVKMHEVIILDDDEDEMVDLAGNARVLTAPISSTDFESGLNLVLRNLELDGAFRLERKGRSKFLLKMIDPSKMPKWLEKARQKDVSQPPEGMFACPHCGSWFSSEFELSMHTKLHYIL